MQRNRDIHTAKTACLAGGIMAGIATACGTQTLIASAMAWPQWTQPLALGGGAVLGIGLGVGLTVVLCRVLRRAARLADEQRAFQAITHATLAGAHAVAWGRAVGASQLSEISPNVEQLLGYPRETWLSPDAWHRFVHPDDAAWARQAYRDGTRSEAPFEVTYRMRHQDGRIVPVRDRAAVVYTADGLRELRGLLQDISDESDTLARVRSSEENFRGIFEQAAIGIALCDRDGVIEQANDRLCDILGQDKPAVLGCRFDALARPAGKRPRSASAAPGETREALRADGETVWLHVSISTRDDRASRDGATIATVEDITASVRTARALEAEEQRLRTMLATLGEGVIMRDARGGMLMYNSAAARIFGLSDAQMQDFHPGSNLVAFLREDSEPYATDELPPMQSLIDGDGHSGVIGIRRADGHVRWLWAHSKPIVDDNGQPVAVVSSLADITRLREAETRLRLADRALDHSADAIMITSAEGLILRVNPAFTRVTGYTAEEVIGHTPAILRSGRHDAAFYTTLWETIRRTGSWQGDIWNRHKDGSLFAERLSISAVRDGSGRLSHYVAVFSDVTEAREKEQRFAHMAQHDALTGLPNRSLMADRLERALSRAARDERSVALMYIDLDSFKTINDAMGHAVGDQLLQQVAKRLRQCVRDSDSVGRQAGDEFLVVLPDLEDGRQASQVAQKIIHALASPLKLGDRHVETSASIGIAIYPIDADTAETLLHRADTALYHAKDAGKNTFRYFTESMNAESEQRLRIEQLVRHALVTNTLSLRFAPRRHLVSGHICAMEALCLWHDTLLGDIEPDRFIGPAGDLDLIRAVDEWMLDRACEEAARWRAAGTACPVVVRIGLRHFRLESFAQTVHDALEKHALPGTSLEIEFQERVLHDNDTVVIAGLQRLRALGVHLAVMEFGTGYNTLTRLQQFGVGRLKMDRSLLAGLLESDEHMAIMRAIIDVGRHLKIDVLAEGLETDGQRERLIAAGCHHAQGGLVGHPMAASEALELLTGAATSG